MKELIKGYIKPCIKILSFVLAFFILLECLSVTYFSKARASQYNNKYSETMSFFNEPANTLQIVGIGNSDLYSGFCSPELWHDYGYVSTSIGSPRQTPQQCLDLLKEVYSNQKPRLVFIECDMLYDKPPEDVDIKKDERDIDVFFDYLSPDSFEEGVKNVFSIFTFHDRWKNKKGVKFANKNHGYKFSNKVVPFKIHEGFMKKTDESEQIVKIHRNNLKAMINYCRKNGSDVVLMTLPSPSSWSYERHNAVAEFADMNNLDFIDFNLLLDEININYAKDFRDKGNHLNYHGAKKVTAYLGEYISKNYEIEDMRKNKDYGYWHKSYRQFKGQLV